MSAAPNTLRQVANPSEGTLTTWDDYTPEVKAMLMRSMPPEVRLRLKNGKPVSKRELDGYLAKYYKLDEHVALWLVNDENEADKRLMRSILKDSFANGKASQRERQGRKVENWTDIDFLTQQAPAPAGHHWLITEYSTKQGPEPQWAANRG